MSKSQNPNSKKATNVNSEDQHAPVTGRFINWTPDDFEGEEDAGQSTPEKPDKYGFSTEWMQSVTIPTPEIDFGDDPKKREGALKALAEFINSIARFHERHLGFTRWCVGTILNRLKPITGEGEKQIPHGEYEAFVNGLGLNADLSQEARWVAATFPRSEAERKGWTEMRNAALEFRKKSRITKSPSSRKPGNTDKKSDFRLPQIETRLKGDVKYYEKALSELPRPGEGKVKVKIKGEGVTELKALCERLRDCLTSILERVKELEGA